MTLTCLPITENRIQTVQHKSIIRIISGENTIDHINISTEYKDFNIMALVLHKTNNINSTSQLNNKLNIIA